MKLRPSEIFFSQDSISNKWGEQSPCGLKLIGETLDELLTESISLEDIPNITAVRKKGKFYTADNRRLWVFRKAEELGFVHEIEVDQVTQRHIRRTKFTTNNGGISIKIRGSGDPGGKTWRTWKPNKFQEVNENTVKSAVRARGINANESRTNVIQDYFCNKTVTGAQHPSTYKLSYNNYNSAKPDVWCDNAFSGNCESPVSGKKIQLSSIITLKAEEDSTLMETVLRGQGPSVNQSKTNVIQDFYSPNIHTSSYSNYNSSMPNFRCDNAFSINSEAPVSDKESQHASIKRSTAEEEQTRRSKSSFESSNRRTSLRVQGPFISQNKTNVNQYSFCNNTVTEAQHASTYKSSYSDDISAKTDVRSDNDFLGICESSSSSFCNFLLWLRAHQFLDFFSGLILHGRKNIKRSSAEEKPTLRRKSFFGSCNRKTLLRVQGPLVKQGRTSVNQDSFCNKPFTEAQHPSTYILQYSNKNSVKPDFLCSKAFFSNSESLIPNKEIKHSRIKRSNSEEEQIRRSKSSLEPSNRNTSLRVQKHFVNQSRTNGNQYSSCNKTVTEAQHTSTYKSSYSDYISAKTDVRCDNDFLIICESSSSSFCNFLLWLGAHHVFDFFSGFILHGRK